MFHIIHNAETQEITQIPFTENEIKEVETAQAKASELVAQTALTDKAVTDAKASRNAKLAKMGFTLAEIENW